MRALPLLLLVAACAEPSDPGVSEAPPPAPVPPATEAPAPPDTVSITTDARALAERPTAPLRVEGACPFEGCTYGAWTTSAETTVYAAADTTRVAFTVPAGTALEADRGFALLTRLGVSVATRATEIYVTYDRTLPLAAGDTLLVLDYEGEGSDRVWAAGVLGFTGAGADVGAPGEGPALRRVSEPVVQWWAHVTAPDGRTGWLWMDRTPDIRGADVLSQ